MFLAENLKEPAPKLPPHRKRVFARVLLVILKYILLFVRLNYIIITQNKNNFRGNEGGRERERERERETGREGGETRSRSGAFSPAFPSRSSRVHPSEGVVRRQRDFDREAA